MESLFDPQAATRCSSELALRVYTSRLLGGDYGLAACGGGNTSVKIKEDGEDILYVMSGDTDLDKVGAADFAPLRLVGVRRLIERDALDNNRLNAAVGAALKCPDAPRPPLETLLHAILPFKWVEHTYADAVLALADTARAETHIRAAFGAAVLVVPYRQSGFELAQACHDIFACQATRETIGMVLMHHGLFTFGDSARDSYERMIGLVSRAEGYLKSHGAWDIPLRFPLAGAVLPAHGGTPASLALAALRRDLSRAAGFPLILSVFSDLFSLAFARRPDLSSLALRGPATPRHAIFTKRLPLLGRDVAAYAEAYRSYLAENAPVDALRLPDPAPRIVLDPQWGLCAAGVNAHYARAAGEITQHALRIMSRAEALDAYTSLAPREVLAAEIEQGGYEEQVRRRDPLSGQVVLVADAVACKDETTALLERGAAVIGLDRDAAVVSLHEHPAFHGLVCDPDDPTAIGAALELGVRAYGGIDRLVGGNALLRDACRPLLALSPVLAGAST